MGPSTPKDLETEEAGADSEDGFEGFGTESEPDPESSDESEEDDAGVTHDAEEFLSLSSGDEELDSGDEEVPLGNDAEGEVSSGSED